MNNIVNFPALLETFFTDRLMHQRQVSCHTIAAYRDTFRLLLKYAQQRLKKAPSALILEDLDAPFIGSFLHYLETERGNCSRSRNLRLAAIHAFFHFAAFQVPEYSALIQRVLAIPSKRYERKQVNFMTHDEAQALLVAPDQHTWMGRRDHTWLLLALTTGLRVSELIGLNCANITLGTGAYVRCYGKGRKHRCTPLTKKTINALRAWLRERQGQPMEPLFPNARGKRLSSDGIQYLLSKYVGIAQLKCPTLNNKRISPHVLRHTTAMNLFHAGVDRTVIALWLGHESVETTQIYLEADLAMKEEILKKTTPYTTHTVRYHADDQLLEFLNSL